MTLEHLSSSERSVVSSFRPRARLLQLLGDQLIGSPRLALFELVKNAYDADASEVVVTMRDLTTARASIEVRDNGDGMSLDTVENIWLVPGHDHKARQRERGERTKLGRLPLGEKGVGRFAVHKLGNLVEVVTRQRNSDEVVLRINWDEIGSSEFLADAKVTAVSRPAEFFVGKEHGTLVRVSSLRGKLWSRGEVRRLARQITSISSPFTQQSDDFVATLQCPQQPGWLEDLPDVEALMGLAPWQFTFELRENRFTWTYSFTQIRGIALPSRKIHGEADGVLLDPRDLPETEQNQVKSGERSAPSTPELQQGIGPIAGKLFVYDRDPEILSRLGVSQSLQTFLDETGGLRVYRDGVRVYNYGEPGDDWLGLDLRRVNSPSKRISSNIIVGAIDLSLAASEGLREKTNREGFVDNDALLRLRALVLGIVSTFEGERNKDKAAIRRLLNKEKSGAKASIERPLALIRKVARKGGLQDEIEPLLAQAQNSYNDMREIMLRAGVSNMSLVLVYHEIEHGMRLLDQHLRGSDADPSVIQQARNLVGVIDGFGDLLRKNKPDDHDLRAVVSRAVELNSVRLSNHDVELTTNLDRLSQYEAVMVRISLSLTLGAVTNLIDNSLYWLGARWPAHHENRERALYLGIDDRSFPEGVALIVADNGPGFVDDLSDLVEPFFTRRPDGMGVGLYYVNLIMHAMGGELRLLEPGDATVPRHFDGAALALIFPRS